MHLLGLSAFDSSTVPSKPARSEPVPAVTQAVTVWDLLRWLQPNSGTADEIPRWPPDVFAIVASLLEKSGGYAHVVSRWPPSDTTSKEWNTFIRTVGKQWRHSWVTGEPLPESLERWWDVLRGAVSTPLNVLRNNPEVCDALLQLLAAADEASTGIGIPASDPAKDNNKFDVRAFDLLRASKPGARSTLCQSIHPSRVTVLPKLHTPQNGINVRSLSHHLSLCHVGEIEPTWSIAPSSANARTLNLLLIPWPFEMTPAQFHEVQPRQGPLKNMPERFGFFSYDHRQRIDVDWFNKLLNSAEQRVSRIDGVIFPELALTPDEHDSLLPRVLKKKAFFVAGVGEQLENGMTRNLVEFDVPVYHAPTYYLSVTQQKHHRWCLERNQLTQYGLGSLEQSCSWWEYTELGPRKLEFVSMRPWLTACVLICEDLARQGAAVDLVRSVAPNLVIALLMDGPQLATRWPARYASVLADDPGCSVLSLTSLGMAGLSRGPIASAPPSRVIGLWKDPIRGAAEIPLPTGCDAVVLSLSLEEHAEWSADGRDDGGMSGYPVYAGIHGIPKP